MTAQTKIAVIGAGPVGLLASHLLHRFQLPYLCFEAAPNPSTYSQQHVKAHWLSARSKLILSQVPGLTEAIDATQEPFELFQHYRYVETLLGEELGRKDQFTPTIPAKLALSRSMFGQQPNHISQSKLLDILYQQLPEKQSIRFGRNVTRVETSETSIRIFEGEKCLAEAETVIICNGGRSQLRKDLGVKMSGEPEICRIINIHFKSVILASLLRSHGPAMLYFVYNSYIPCVLVAHSYDKGVFVLQVPNYEPFVDLLQVYSPEEIIINSVDHSFRASLTDIEIITVGQWRLRAEVASQMSVDGVVHLAGDAAHSFTPAGGFGMNCGFQDVNQLTHLLHMASRNPHADQLMRLYEQERMATNRLYMQKSLANYTETNQVATHLGFPVRLAEFYFQLTPKLPSFLSGTSAALQSMRLLAAKTFFNKRKVNPTLQLFFDQFDLQVQNHSSLLKKIYTQNAKGSIYDIWACKGATLDEIHEVAGRIEPQNIHYSDEPLCERVVRRDGVVLKK